MSSNEPRTYESEHAEFSEYLNRKERRALGHNQQVMLGRMRSIAKNDTDRRFSIQCDAGSRRTAKTLDRRGLIVIQDTATECWTVEG